MRSVGEPELTVVKVFPREPALDAVLEALPTVRRRLCEQGVAVPTVTGCRPSRALRVIERPGEPPLVRFARSGASWVLGVEIPSGRVIRLGAQLEWHLTHPMPGVAAIHRWTEPVLAASSLAQFDESTRLVARRFPFYDQDAEAGECGKVAGELREALTGIAGGEATPFWERFLIDRVEIGGCSTQELIGGQAARRALTEEDLDVVVRVAWAVADAGGEGRSAIAALRGAVTRPHVCSAVPLDGARIVVPSDAPRTWIAAGARGAYGDRPGGRTASWVQATAELWTAAQGESDYVLTVELEQPADGGPVTARHAHLRLM